MPTLPALTINSTKLNVQELYQESISDPTDTTPSTAEMLNGALDGDNYAGSVPPWACQPGSMARAIHIPFERWEFVYAKQTSSEATADNNVNVTVAALSTRIFIPWDAGLIYVGWQAFWRHDASTSTVAALTSTLHEQWRAKFFLDGAEVSAGRLLLTPTRWDNEDAGGTARWAELGFSEEPRWVWHSHSICVPHDDATFPDFTDKGYHTILCKVSADIQSDDPKTAKLLIPTGALTILAVR